MNLSKLLHEIDVNLSVFRQTPRTDVFFFEFVYTSDSSKSETYLNIFCYRHEVETPKEKAVPCHFWYFLGNISRTILFPEVFG